jgi:hypothetical protein
MPFNLEQINEKIIRVDIKIYQMPVGRNYVCQVCRSDLNEKEHIIECYTFAP